MFYSHATVFWCLNCYRLRTLKFLFSIYKHTPFNFILIPSISISNHSLMFWSPIFSPNISKNTFFSTILKSYFTVRIWYLLFIKISLLLSISVGTKTSLFGFVLPVYFSTILKTYFSVQISVDRISKLSSYFISNHSSFLDFSTIKILFFCQNLINFSIPNHSAKYFVPSLKSYFSVRTWFYKN